MQGVPSHWAAGQETAEPQARRKRPHGGVEWPGKAGDESQRGRPGEAAGAHRAERKAAVSLATSQQGETCQQPPGELQRNLTVRAAGEGPGGCVQSLPRILKCSLGQAAGAAEHQVMKLLTSKLQAAQQQVSAQVLTLWCL